MFDLTESTVLKTVQNLYTSTEELKPKAIPILTKKATAKSTLKAQTIPTNVDRSNPITYVPKLSARRCYRVVTYRMTDSGRRVLIDLLQNTVYNNSSQKKITNNAIVCESKKNALSEKFSPYQTGHPKCGSGILPRILVAFECWGNVYKNPTSASSYIYENVKYMCIEQCLDNFPSQPKNRSKFPVAPHFFAGPDHAEAPRLRSTRSVHINRALLDSSYRHEYLPSPPTNLKTTLPPPPKSTGRRVGISP